MFELSISINAQKQKYIDEIYKKLNSEIKMDSGILVKENYRGRSYFSIAVPDEKKEYYKSKILDYIVFVIIDEYKFNFYKDNLMIGRQTLIIEPFLKAISIFDCELDTEIIKQKIELSREILIDSFYYFKLQCLRDRWQKTANIINQNKILESSSSMIEVLKYLTTMSDNLVLLTELFIGKKQLKIMNLFTSKCFKRDMVGCSDFLTEIVRLNPMKIKVKIGTSEDDEVFDLINKIFNEKIYVLN